VIDRRIIAEGYRRCAVTGPNSLYDMDRRRWMTRRLMALEL